MTIDEAIEILGEISRCTDLALQLREEEACKLGIEALKEVQKARQGNPALDGELLPGETDD